MPDYSGAPGWSDTTKALKTGFMDTLLDLLETAADRFPGNTYLYEKRGDEWTKTSYAGTREQVYAFGAGLLSLGVKPGDRIAILSEGKNSWIIGELGILSAGCCSVPLSIKLSPAEVEFRLSHSEARMALVSIGQLAKIKEVRSRLPNLEKVILLDEAPETGDGYEYTYKGVAEAGKQFLSENPGKLQEVMKTVGPETLANITYTSGTTSVPKGIMLTHGNYICNVKQSLTLMDIPDWYKTLAFLPWDHCFAHTACLYCFMAKGAGVGSLQTGKNAHETLKNIPVNIKELKPDLLMSVPAISKNFRKSIESAIAAKGKVASSLFKLGLKTAYAYNGLGYNKGRGWRFVLSPFVKFFDNILFAKVREGFGGNLAFFIGGGALLDIELQRFFLAIGIPVCQGYGLSEASPVISSNSLSSIKIGTSGRLVKHMDLKICDTEGNELPEGQAGEIVIKGGNVMKGYWKNPEATAEAIKDGWLYTGDLGYMDEDGFLVVKGRFKSLLIASDGEKYSPEGIEEAIVENSKLIDQCMLHNNQDPYTIGLIVPNTVELNRQISKHGAEPGTPEGIEAGIKLIRHEINAYYKHGKYSGMFPERWLPAAFAILPEPFTEKNLMINSTMKMVRGKIGERYEDTIRFLYTPAAKNPVNDLNRANLAIWYSS